MARDANFHQQYTNRKVNVRVLLDLDQVLADFEGYFLKKFRETYPDEPFVSLEERHGFWLRDQYDALKPGLSKDVSSIYNAKGFFQKLPEIPGAIEAAKEMSKMEGIRESNSLDPEEMPIIGVSSGSKLFAYGIMISPPAMKELTSSNMNKVVLLAVFCCSVDVFICSSPLMYYRHCLREKYLWVEHHLGKNWVEKVILTKDKTMANGHLLIDDRVNITGVNANPSWEHVVFNACHNTRMDTKGKRRLANWTDGTWRDLIEDVKKRV